MPNPQPLILVIDDDADLRRLLDWQLGSAGFRVIGAPDGAEGLVQFQEHDPDLIILDVMMPMMDGWEVLRDLRQRSDVPVLMLTALSHESDQVTGLDQGADDYVVKPFTLRQLLARVRALLRRAGKSSDSLVIGSLTLDLAAHEASLNGKLVELTRHEYGLLEVLARHPGRAFSRTELLARCWGPDHNGVDRVVDVHMSSLRRKLGRKRDLIATVRGIGYRLNSE
jgi:DNA-binding response OmpR family regulator